MDSFYKYKRLNLATDAIRLVRVLKGDVGPIKCEMIETYLNKVEGVPYEALSYVWGKGESENEIWAFKKILVDDCHFKVTSNLFEALSNLRQPAEDRLLWIDAICIDQSHAAERGQQVGQMCRIYQNSHNVIIWLGASTQEIDLLFDWMRRLDHRMLLTDCQHMRMWENQWSLLDWQDERNFGYYSIGKSLQQLLRREWFSRVWVIQEAALARAAIITCGRNVVNSRTFVMMPKILGVSCNEDIRSRLEIMPGLMRKLSWWSGPESQDLGMLLRKFGKSKATDPRDNIYALLGLSKDAFESKFLRPNYRISQGEAIQHTVAYILHRSWHEDREDWRDMPMWNMDQFLAALEKLPSRVHEWRSRRTETAPIMGPISQTEWECIRSEELARLSRTYTPWVAIAAEERYYTVSISERSNAIIDWLQMFDTEFHR